MHNSLLTVTLTSFCSEFRNAGDLWQPFKLACIVSLLQDLEDKSDPEWVYLNRKVTLSGAQLLFSC
jgi:hypothetical protein